MKKYLSYLLTGILSILMLSCSENDQNSKNVFTVTFNSMGGTEIVSVEVEKGMLITKPDDPTLENNTFEGWFTDEDYGKEWNFEKDVVTKDITLYAKWAVTSSTDIKEETLLGYWKMEKAHYCYYDKFGVLLSDAWNLTGDDGDFFDLKFEENGIYHDISPYEDDDEGIGHYSFDKKNRILKLDIETEHASTFKILELNEESLILEYKEGIVGEDYFIDTRYFKREKEI